MEQIHDRVAGLDVHRDSVVACVRATGPRGGAIAEKERFGTTTAQLSGLVGWLTDRQVSLVAMEATGVYWRHPTTRWRSTSRCGCATPSTCRTCLDARPTWRMPSGWRMWSPMAWSVPASCRLPRSASYGNSPAIARGKSQVDTRVAEVQRLEKVLQDACIKLTSVASKVLTQSGRAMVEALIAGEGDPAVLAELAQGKLRPKVPQLREALTGHFGPQHAVAAGRILDHVDFLDASMPR